MSERQIFMGIDTSNYTTSVGLVSSDGDVLANVKLPLAVREGECGLRQSDALFVHTKNMPMAMQRIREILDGEKPVAIGVSAKPRNEEGSYMPVFLAGIAAAESIGAALSVPVYRFSHQCGHIMAALHSAGRPDLLSGDFAAFHISGGTTELVLVKPCDMGFNTRIVGGTLDLNAGQVIDRVGVKLGMPFPAGAHLERAALSYQGRLSVPKPAVSGTHVNLSGLENMAEKIYTETQDKSYVSAFVLQYISRALEQVAQAYMDENGKLPLVCAGGVMCNSVIRQHFLEAFGASFAVPELSSDNAVGVAVLAKNAFLH